MLAASGQTPDVVALASGNFAVVWEEDTGSGTESIHDRIFSADGTALTDDFTINTVAAAAEVNRNPDATALPDGTFYVTWQGEVDILGRVVDGAGHPVGSEIVVNPFASFTEFSPDATLFNGKLLNVFVDGSHQLTNSAGQTDPDRGIGAQTLDPNGSEFAHTHSFTDQQHGPQLWSVGDFNGDHRDDILRYDPGVSGAEVFTSNGTSFTGGASWTGAGNDSQGWYVGDFNGDGKDDVLRYHAGVSGAEVFLSTGSSFVSAGSWTPAGNEGFWYVGDYNGDGKDDLFRHDAGVSGAEVFLSTGSSFAAAGSWTSDSNNGADGWYRGDFNGDHHTDIFRVLPGVSGADMFINI